MDKFHLWSKYHWMLTLVCWWPNTQYHQSSRDCLVQLQQEAGPSRWRCPCTWPWGSWGGWRGGSWRSWGSWGGRRWWRKEIQLTPQGFHRLQRSSTCSTPRTPPGTQTGEQINLLHRMIKFVIEGDATRMTRRLIVPLPPEALCYSALPWHAAPWVNIFHETCRTGAQACKRFNKHFELYHFVRAAPKHFFN